MAELSKLCVSTLKQAWSARVSPDLYFLVFQSIFVITLLRVVCNVIELNGQSKQNFINTLNISVFTS